MTQLTQAAVDRFQQVVGFVALNLQVGVADDVEQVRTLDLRSWKELLDVGAHHVFEERERQPGSPRERVGDWNEPGQDMRNLHARKLRPVAVPHDNGEVLTQIGNKRKRVAGVKGQRRQDRTHFA